MWRTDVDTSGQMDRCSTSWNKFLLETTTYFYLLSSLVALYAFCHIQANILCLNISAQAYTKATMGNLYVTV